MLSNQSGADENAGIGIREQPKSSIGGQTRPSPAEGSLPPRVPLESSVLRERANASGANRAEPTNPIPERWGDGGAVPSARSARSSEIARAVQHPAIGSSNPGVPPLLADLASASLAAPASRTTPGRLPGDLGKLPYPPSGSASDAGGRPPPVVPTTLPPQQSGGNGASWLGAQPSQAAAAAAANAQFNPRIDMPPTPSEARQHQQPPPWIPQTNLYGGAAPASIPGGPVHSVLQPGGVGGGSLGPGPFGFTPFDGGANHINMWNYGNETGPKHYVVMCKDDVELRASPTYADDTRIGHFLHPGQVVVIDERRMVSGSWFLHLADGRGWAFEAKERLLVMTEAKEFERGLWHYSVVCDDDVETRLTPTYSDDARTNVILGPGDCIAVDERCSVAGARFLKLADGRGWVFETKDRLLVMSEVRAKAQEARDFARGLWHYTVVCDDDVEIRAAPTYSDEARTGLTVHPGDCVAIDERCRVAAVWFLRLADGRGWVFETKDSRRVMMQLH